MAQEDLVFNFVRNGLSQLRRAFSDVEGDLGDIQDETDATQDSFGDLQRGVEDSATTIEDAIAEAADGIESFATETAQAAQTARQELDEVGAADLEITDTGGLEALQQDAQALSTDITDVAEQAQAAGADLEQMGADGTDAGGNITTEMQQAETAVTDVGERAADSAEELQSEFADASDRAITDIEAIQDRLEGFDSTDIDVAGDIGGSLTSSAIGSAIGAGGASALVSKLTGAEEPVQELKRVMEQLDIEVEQVEESVEQASAAAEGMDAPFRDAEKKAQDLEDQVDDVRESTEDLNQERKEFTNMAAEDIAGGGGDDGGIGGLGGFALGRFGGSASSAASSLSGLVSAGTAAVTTIGTVGAAAAVGTKQMADFAAAQAEAAQKLKVAEAQSGVTATEVEELFLVAQRLDSEVDLDSVRDAFKEIALRTEEAREGTGEAREAFDRLGISMEELRGKGTAEVFRLVRRRASELTAQQRILTLEQIAGGEAGEELARVFGLQADEYERLKDSVQEDSLTAGQIEQMDKLRQEYTAAQQDLRDLKNELAVTFGPEAVSLLKTFSQAAQDALAALQGERETGALSKAGLPTGQRRPDVQQPTMGPDEQVQFGSTGGSGDVPTAVQDMREALSQMETAVAVAREKMSRGLIDEEQMVRQIRSARQAAADELLKLEQQSPDLIPDSKVDSTIAKLKRIKRRLEELTSTSFDVEPQQATPAGQEQFQTSMPSPSIEAMGGGLSSLQGAADAADSVGDINSLISATREQFDTLNNDEAQAFIAKLQKAKAEMQENQAEAKMIGDAMARSIARSADRVFQSIGQAVSDAVFGGGGGPGEASSRLQLFNAKKQKRQLRQALREGQISYREFSLRMQAQQKKIQQRQEQLNEAMSGGFAQAADSMLSAFKQIAKQLITEITAVIVKMLALKAITTALNISSGGIGGSIISNLGGGAFLDSGASGGTVKQDGLAIIHEGEEIVPSKTVDTLKSIVPSVQSGLQANIPSPSAPAPTAMNIAVNVQGETTTTGRDIKTTYDTTAQVQRRKGRK